MILAYSYPIGIQSGSGWDVVEQASTHLFTLWTCKHGSIAIVQIRVANVVHNLLIYIGLHCDRRSL